jgi:hypothetical protein
VIELCCNSEFEKSKSGWVVVVGWVSKVDGGEVFAEILLITALRTSYAGLGL